MSKYTVKCNEEIIYYGNNFDHAHHIINNIIKTKDLMFKDYYSAGTKLYYHYEDIKENIYLFSIQYAV